MIRFFRSRHFMSIQTERAPGLRPADGTEPTVGPVVVVLFACCCSPASNYLDNNDIAQAEARNAAIATKIVRRLNLCPHTNPRTARAIAITDTTEPMMPEPGRRDAAKHGLAGDHKR